MNGNNHLPSVTHPSYFFNRPMPKGLEGLTELALDLRWTWSHFSDRLWERLDPVAWDRMANPYFILQSVSQARLEEAACDQDLKRDLQIWLKQRQQYLQDPGWFGQEYSVPPFAGVAYFSMEFGLSEALPIYSGGLGILAGDHLKTASDLGVPLVAVGLLYQQGYFRQMLSPEAWQIEAYPYNDPISLPIIPAVDRAGGWLRVKLTLPGRTLLIRVWQASVGKVRLYLLDSNDPLNNPRDRSVTANLYPAGQEQRLIQEIVLGIGGWMALEALDFSIDVCHLNEGHAAFVIFARALSVMRKTGLSFPVALAATRAGNVFTTHTPVEAAFDRYAPSLIRPYAEYLAEVLRVPVADLMALGRQDRHDMDEPFNMAYLAVRGAGCLNGVSRLHGTISRSLFRPLFPRWPEEDIPVGHITNGVHVPSWDSPVADELWTRVCGKGRWGTTLEELCPLIEKVPDEELWEFRMAQRQRLVGYVRRRLVHQLQEHGVSGEDLQLARHVLDPNVLTLGFARRFTEYKRPTLLLTDSERISRLMRDPQRPVQLIVAGKAHPHDQEGKRLVQALAKFSEQPELRDRVVFLEDYEISLAQELVAGVDVWLNTPRRPQEASGTSGMKVLVNGGLNLSELDGWWAEGYTPDVGWRIGGPSISDGPDRDAREAEQLYHVLEQEIIPAFYDRNHHGYPRTWLARVRASMSQLTPRYSSNRMMREYVTTVYAPAARSYQSRIDKNGTTAKDLSDWQAHLDENWRWLRFGTLDISEEKEHFVFRVQVFCGEVNPHWLQVELFANQSEDHEASRTILPSREPIPGMVNAFVYSGEVPTSRPADHYTPRIVPFHPWASVPLEACYIYWRS